MWYRIVLFLTRYLHVFCCLFTFVLYIFLLVLQFLFWISLRVTVSASFTIRNRQLVYRDVILLYQYSLSIFDDLVICNEAHSAPTDARWNSGGNWQSILVS
jgi:hypothetical protein